MVYDTFHSTGLQFKDGDTAHHTFEDFLSYFMLDLLLPIPEENLYQCSYISKHMESELRVIKLNTNQTILSSFSES